MTNLQGTEAVTLDKLLVIPEFETELRKYRIDSDEQLVTLILENERSMFEVIFKDYNFDGNEDAIDILFTVSKEMSAKFRNLSPSVTHDYKYKHPKIYQSTWINGSCLLTKKFR
jgi:hypothetical protein